MGGGVQEFDEIVTKRREFLAALEERPATKPELVDLVDASRSTVDRAIDDLEDQDLVTRPDNEYELTLVGKQAFEQHEAYLGRLGDLDHAREVISALPRDVALGVEVLEGATVETTDPHDPVGPLELAAGAVEGATALRAVMPAVVPLLIDVLTDRAADGARVDLLVAPEVAETAARRYERFRAQVEDGSITLSTVEQRPVYGLWIAETPEDPVCVLSTYSETGVQGVIVNDRTAASEWADDTYDRLASSATEVSSVPR